MVGKLFVPLLQLGQGRGRIPKFAAWLCNKIFGRLIGTGGYVIQYTFRGQLQVLLAGRCQMDVLLAGRRRKDVVSISLVARCALLTRAKSLCLGVAAGITKSLWARHDMGTESGKGKRQRMSESIT